MSIADFFRYFMIKFNLIGNLLYDLYPYLAKRREIPLGGCEITYFHAFTCEKCFLTTYIMLKGKGLAKFCNFL